MKKFSYVFLMFFVLSLGLAARAAEPRGDYLLGPDDVIEITVSNHEDFNKTITILPDGKFTYPRAGVVEAAGKTAKAVAAFIQKKLAETLNRATVTVSVKEVHSRRARIAGAVKTAGAYDLKPGWRVMDLVALAGGLSTKPTRISGRVIRAGNVIPLNIEQADSQPDSAANVLLKPDDLVMLDEQDIRNQVHVIGKVVKPGAYDLEEGLNPVSLVAQSGSADEGAALSNAYVLRKSTRIPMDLHSILVEGKTDERISKFQFLPGDVLIIPENLERYGVMGQVTKPGYYPLPNKKEEATVLRVLAQAGGQLVDADLHNAAINRLVDDKITIIPVDIDGMLKGSVADSISLKVDDVLYIPKRNNEVHVIGQVTKPGAYDLKEGMTLMSLIAEAGSAADGAALSKAYISRGGTQIPLNLRAALVEGRPDANVSKFKLQSGDVLVVPDTQNQIHVIGQVAKPGAYDLDDNLSVVGLVAQAGSPTPQAALTKAHVLRAGTQISLDLQAVLVDGSKDENITSFKFQPGDVLVIPENQVRYGVMGQVAKPGYYAYPEKKDEATVLKALGSAGGQLADGDLQHAVIVRRSSGAPNSAPTVIPVDILAMLRKGKLAANIELQPEDVLYVPSKKKKFKIGDLLSILTPLSYLGIGN